MEKGTTILGSLTYGNRLFPFFVVDLVLRLRIAYYLTNFRQTNIIRIAITYNVCMGRGSPAHILGRLFIRPRHPLRPDPYLILGHHLADERQVLLDLFHVCRAQQGLRGSGDEREHLLL